MTDCEDRALLIQADLDGELDAASAAELASHIQTCPACAALQEQLATLSDRLRREVRRIEAPEALRRALSDRFAQAESAYEPAETEPARTNVVPMRPRRTPLLFAFGTGAAMAAAVAVMLMPSASSLQDELIASHVRALQPGHLIDVASTDQHTVKPWFNGRLDYSPPVKDFAAAGFPLMGGRLDAIGDKTVAVLVYRSDKHIIDLFVWPTAARIGVPGGTRDGFHVVGWQQGGMTFRAISDVEPGRLADFARRWQDEP